MDRRQQRREARRQELVDAALLIVREEGLDNLTIARLAREVELAVGALYRYFPGKDGVIAAMQESALQTFGAFVAERLHDAELPEAPAARALARLRIAFFSWPAFADAHPSLHRLIDAVISDPRPLLDDEAMEAVQQALDPVLIQGTLLFTEAEASGLLSQGDNRVRTHVLWASLHGVFHFRKRDPRQASGVVSAQLMEELFQALMRGWGAPAELLGG